jgi:RimJ/RimL family protein N-acetyltransferase
VLSHELRTERLRLVPLDADEMLQFAEDWPALQSRLRATPGPAWITDPPTLDAVRLHRDWILRDPEAWLWWTFWQVVLAVDGQHVGLVDFKGPPGPEGRVAIGCAFAPAHRGRGYATEAVRRLVAWAMVHARVRSVVAETDAANHRARRVLRAVGFVPVAREGDGPPRDRDAAQPLIFSLMKGAPYSEDAVPCRRDANRSVP